MKACSTELDWEEGLEEQKRKQREAQEAEVQQEQLVEEEA